MRQAPIEVLFKIEEMDTTQTQGAFLHLRGTVAIPRFAKQGSRPKRVAYSPKILQRAHGMTFPLWEMHGEKRTSDGGLEELQGIERQIALSAGYAQTHYDVDKDALIGDAYVTSQHAAEAVLSGKYKAFSMGVFPTLVYGTPDFDVVADGKWEEISLVDVPGIPETEFKRMECMVKLTEAFTQIPVKELSAQALGDDFSAATASSGSASGEMDAASGDSKGAANKPAPDKSNNSGASQGSLSANQDKGEKPMSTQTTDGNKGKENLPMTGTENGAGQPGGQSGGASPAASAAQKGSMDSSHVADTSGLSQGSGKSVEALQAELKKLQEDYAKLDTKVIASGDASARKELTEVFAQANDIVKQLRERNLAPASPQEKPTVSTDGAYSPAVASNGNGFSRELSEAVQDSIQHAANVASGRSREIGTKIFVPKLDLPALGRGKYVESIDARVQAMTEFEHYPQKLREAYQARKLKEAISTTTANVPLAVEGIPPLVVVPSDIIASLRDTVQVQKVAYGADRCRFGTIAVPTFAARTQLVDQGSVSQTITSVDVVPAEVGVEQEIGYKAAAQITGDVMASVTQSFRVAELVYEDNLILNAANTATVGASQYTTYVGQTSESSITSANTMTAATLSSALKNLSTRGVYGNLVAVLHPIQYDALLNDTAVVRYLQDRAQPGGEDAIVRSGIISDMFGIEVRRSTQVVTGTGSGVTTYHGMVYKMNYALGLGITDDLMIEVFRRQWTSSTLINAYADYASAAIVPKAIQALVSA